jgi:hypothetical protein
VIRHPLIMAGSRADGEFTCTGIGTSGNLEVPWYGGIPTQTSECLLGECRLFTLDSKTLNDLSHNYFEPIMLEVTLRIVASNFEMLV